MAYSNGTQGRAPGPTNYIEPEVTLNRYYWGMVPGAFTLNIPKENGQFHTLQGSVIYVYKKSGGYEKEGQFIPIARYYQRVFVPHFVYKAESFGKMRRGSEITILGAISIAHPSMVDLNVLGISVKKIKLAFSDLSCDQNPLPHDPILEQATPTSTTYGAPQQQQQYQQQQPPQQYAQQPPAQYQQQPPQQYAQQPQTAPYNRNGAAPTQQNAAPNPAAPAAPASRSEDFDFTEDVPF